MSMRLEQDLLGAKQIPMDAYWGVNTARAIENFPITGTKIGSLSHLVRGLAKVKTAAALANFDLGILPLPLKEAIVAACKQIEHGEFHDQFVVDVIQGGAGTSTNMNANEVIANISLELLGHPKGTYSVLDPNDHVNRSQSTNDAYPTAIKVGLIDGIDELELEMAALERAFEAKAKEFDHVLKVGRTQLQDAVPMTLGQEFRTFSIMLAEDRARLLETSLLLHEINLGATAIGTGLNAPAGYKEVVCQHLCHITGRPFVTAANLIEATQDVGAFVQLSGILKRVAVKLSKTCNDLRLLSSGPRSGFAEIVLPPVQAGSSIMPGKINPVIPEVVNQVAFTVIGNDITVTMAAEGGQLQLNAFEPVIAMALFDSISRLKASCRILRERCVEGIEANIDWLAARVADSIGLATALNPYLGYYVATEVAQEALVSGKTVPDIVLQRGLLNEADFKAILQPETLANASRSAL